MSKRGTDMQGREYALVSRVQVGDLLECDGSFSCIKGGAIVTIREDEAGLYFRCKEGHHSMESQINGDFYLGLYPTEKA